MYYVTVWGQIWRRRRGGVERWEHPPGRL